MAAQCQPGPAGCQASGGAENQQDSGQTEDHGIVKLQGTFKEKEKLEILWEGVCFLVVWGQ